jgi:DnaJ like chaperone protein
MSKKKYGKWIAGGLGWALGGPIGAMFGFALGSMFDKSAESSNSEFQGNSSNQYRHQTQGGDFSRALLILSASVMKADGKVVKAELQYVKDFFEKQFGAEVTQEFLIVLRELLKQNIELRDVCTQIRFNMEHPKRLHLLHYLFGIAQADGDVHQTEIDVIQHIARLLAINTRDFESIRAMFQQSSESSYKILEIENTATNEEVKKAYRKMAIKYHPDKVGNMGEEYKTAAKDKFLKVQEAYDAIKKERGIK